MKNKFLKYFLIVVAILFLVGAGICFYLKFYADLYTYGNGQSMMPTMEENKSYLFKHLGLFGKPKVDDIVYFCCLNSKCAGGKHNADHLTKRLIKINEQGCYWFEGDNKDHSWDSRNYGWLCPKYVFGSLNFFSSSSDIDILNIVDPTQSR